MKNILCVVLKIHCICILCLKVSLTLSADIYQRGREVSQFKGRFLQVANVGLAARILMPSQSRLTAGSLLLNSESSGKADAGVTRLASLARKKSFRARSPSAA